MTSIQNFVVQLNSVKDSVIVVEGKRDSNALRKLGCYGKILEFYKFGGMINFTDSVARYQRIIVLFDGDKKGRYLTGKTSVVTKKNENRPFFQKKTKTNNKRKNYVY